MIRAGNERRRRTFSKEDAIELETGREPLNKPRILVAEDDPVSLRVVQAFLTKWNYRVVVATDGLEALRILESSGCSVAGDP